MAALPAVQHPKSNLQPIVNTNKTPPNKSKPSQRQKSFRISKPFATMFNITVGETKELCANHLHSLNQTIYQQISVQYLVFNWLFSVYGPMPGIQSIIQWLWFIFGGNQVIQGMGIL